MTAKNRLAIISPLRRREARKSYLGNCYSF